MIAFINTVHVDPSDHREVVDLLSEVIREPVGKARGFIPSALHRSPYGTRFATYARWATPDDHEETRQNPATREALAGPISLARSEAGTYEVIEAFKPAG